MRFSLFSLGRGGLGFAGCSRSVSARRALRAVLAVRSRSPLAFFRLSPGALVAFGPGGRGDCLLVLSFPWARRWERFASACRGRWDSAFFAVVDTVAPRWAARRWPM